jgi:hypothetical protein
MWTYIARIRKPQAEVEPLADTQVSDARAGITIDIVLDCAVIALMSLGIIRDGSQAKYVKHTTYELLEERISARKGE